ncbi:MAG: hypothetical protein MJ033_01885 [Victivallaceae bacterium]|nr:hypothetical protein [Victivallaceae bacterium]
MAHYTAEELEIYRHGEMSVLGRIACAEHLKKCPQCAKLLKKLESDDHFLDALRISVKTYAQFAPEQRHPTSV